MGNHGRPAALCRVIARIAGRSRLNRARPVGQQFYAAARRYSSALRYPRFRSRGFFVGTGVMEAACKTIIGGRLKRSGMFWTVRGANSIIALRCCRLSGNFEDYWERRRA